VHPLESQLTWAIPLNGMHKERQELDSMIGFNA
jgi:hypothetical protein